MFEAQRETGVVKYKLCTAESVELNEICKKGGKEMNEEREFKKGGE